MVGLTRARSRQPHLAHRLRGDGDEYSRYKRNDRQEREYQVMTENVDGAE